jgi:hypothetical protein
MGLGPSVRIELGGLTTGSKSCLLIFTSGMFFMCILSVSTSWPHIFESKYEKRLVAQGDHKIFEKDKELENEEEIVEVDAVRLARLHAALVRERSIRCRDIDWITACDRIGNAGARRRRLSEFDGFQKLENLTEQALMYSDDPSVVYDSNCLRVFRLILEYNMTFPYRASQLLRSGGNQTMVLFIQHGAMHDADTYFCSFAKLMMEQTHRPFKDILVIAPAFEYKSDKKLYPFDAFWNSTKVSIVLFFYFEKKIM